MKHITLCFLALLAVYLTAGAMTWAADEPREGHDELPAAARAAVEQQVPGGRIADVEIEHLMVRLFEVEVVVDGRKRELTVTADGTVLEIEEADDPERAPDAVRVQVSRQAQGGKLKDFEKIEVLAEVKPVPLAEPRVEYEAEFRVGRQERECRWSAAGEPVQAGPDDAHENDDAED